MRTLSGYVSDLIENSFGATSIPQASVMLSIRPSLTAPKLVIPMLLGKVRTALATPSLLSTAITFAAIWRWFGTITLRSSADRTSEPGLAGKGADRAVGAAEF